MRYTENFRIEYMVVILHTVTLLDSQEFVKHARVKYPVQLTACSMHIQKLFKPSSLVEAETHGEKH